jgi:hypothetical protein
VSSGTPAVGVTPCIAVAERVEVDVFVRDRAAVLIKAASGSI